MVQFDNDLSSIQEARDLLRAAESAVFDMLSFSQEEVDRIVKAMADAAYNNAEKLARMAVDETGFGKYEDKIIKNRFASRNVYEHIRGMKTVGIINRDNVNKAFDVAVPMGVVTGIIPSTNPTSTTIYKALIAVKSRNAIVFSPHPAAKRCILETTDLMRRAAESAGAPKGLISCMTQPTLQGTSELFKSEKTAMILATGGSAMVRAAYASGRPALGVGPGNVPSFIEKSADVPRAVADIVAGKSFDNGVICASEQAMLVEREIKNQAVEELKKNGAYLCSAEEKAKLEKVMVGPDFHVNPRVVGHYPHEIASMAGFSVPRDTSILVVFMDKVGREDPLSFEKLSPVLCFYEVRDWQEGCERSIEILNYGGLGHTMAIHSGNEKIIEEFALYKPAFRIIVNTSSTHGAIGYSTALPPALTLGPGSIGGSSTSDNISPLHLMNIKHVAYGIREIGGTRSGQSRTDDPVLSNVRLEREEHRLDENLLSEIERRVLELARKQDGTGYKSTDRSFVRQNVSDERIQQIIDEVRKNR
jgi:acetaldehyde dehydrogenase (acetylating)